MRNYRNRFKCLSHIRVMFRPFFAVRKTQTQPKTQTRTQRMPLNLIWIPISEDTIIIQNANIEESGLGSECSVNAKEQILFHHNYFKILEKNGDSLRAMCVPCGVDENNSPVTVCSAKHNVSSNLITHLKVKFDNNCLCSN